MSNHVETGSLIQDQNVTGLSINRKDGEEKVPNDAKPSRFLERQRNRLEHSTSVQSPSVDEVSEGASGISLSDKTKRVIYPNVPYSPYSSPRVRRKVPLKESRRVSIDKSGAFLQLNQYRLLDSIGQVWSEEKCFTVPTFRCIYTSSSGLSELLNVYMNVGIENMEIRRKIVQGSYGLVKLAYNEEDDTHYAMKILSKKKLLKKAGIFGIQNQNRKGVNPLDRIYREIAVLKKLHHPNIVKLVEVLDDPVEDNLYMVFELVKRGEVMHLPTDSPLSEAQAWEYFRDVVLGLEYLHFQRIIHRDIKPSNLLLGENGHVQIADLSVCNEFDGIDACLNNSAGTPAFTAPEAISATTHFSGKAYDVWSLGVTLFGFVYGRVPFDGGSVPAVYNSIRNEPLVLPKSPETSKDLQDLISRMLEKDPSKRITLQDIKNHKWVTKNGRYVLPTEDENCQLVEVTDEEIRDVVTSIPKLNTLILIKAMLKKHSFQNPFSLDTRLRRLYCTGRSHSAPGSCNFFNSLPSSSQNSLTPVSEASSSQHQRASKK